MIQYSSNYYSGKAGQFVVLLITPTNGDSMNVQFFVDLAAEYINNGDLTVMDTITSDKLYVEILFDERYDSMTDEIGDFYCTNEDAIHDAIEAKYYIDNRLSIS